MTILQLNIGFESLIKEVRERGVAFVPEALTPEFREELCADIATLEMTEEKMDEDFLKLKFDFAKLYYPFDGHDALSNLGLHLGWQARTHRGMLDNLSNWHPNEVAIQRYRDNSDDIGAHKDYQRDRYLIAIVTAEGYGRFEVLTDDGEKVKYSFETGPGSLTLLWAPELTKNDGDRRPLHRALAPKYGSRTSVTYRLVTNELEKAIEQSEQRGAVHWHGLIEHTHPPEYPTENHHVHDRYWYVPSDPARMTNPSNLHRWPAID